MGRSTDEQGHARGGHSILPLPRYRPAVAIAAAVGGIVWIAMLFIHGGNATMEHAILAFSATIFVVVMAGYLLLAQGRRLAEMEGRLSFALDERRRTDMALREAEARLRDVLEGSVLGIFIHRDLRPLYVNSAFAAILGYESAKELLLFRNVLDFVAPELREQVRGHFLARVGDEKSQGSYETRGVRQDGRVIWMELGIRPIMWGGEPVVFITASDITERKRAEEALRLSESRLSRAQRISRLGNWEWHIDDGALWWSDEVYLIFGLDPASFHPSYETFLNSVHPDDRGIVSGAVNETLEKGAPYSIDHRIVLPDGAERFVHEQGEVRIGQSGRVAAMIGTVHDITERKLTEQRLRESEIRHRDFAADVAHELRTPLSVMRANLDNMADSTQVKALRGDVDAMARLVEQLLAASRAEMLTVGPDAVADLHQVAVSVATHMAPLAIQKGRTIEVTGESGTVAVRGDSNALEQAVRNLVDNAIKYSDSRSVITIRVSDGPPAVSVTDRGRPVPPEMQEAIFTRFIRADRRAGGAGLGLSIVRRIVRAHGGRIDVGLPEDGDGAVFTISFPLGAERAGHSVAAHG